MLAKILQGMNGSIVVPSGRRAVRITRAS